MLTKAKEGYCFSWEEIEAISPLFRRDVEAFGDYLGRKKGLVAKGPRRALRPKSIEHRKFQLRQAFSIWHRHSGEGHLVDAVGALAQPNRATVILEFFLKRRNGEATSQSDGMLNVLLVIARHYAKLGDVVVEELQSYRGMVGYRQIGLTKKVRAMLRQFDSERNVGLLIHLPGRIYRNVRVKKRISVKDALEIRRAVTIELELMTAMRRGVHSRLRSDVHLQRYRTADGELLFLDIEGRETKNGEPGGYPLPPPTAELLLFYLQKCRPVLDPTAEGWFYPGEIAGQPLCEDQVSREIAGAVFAHTGLEITAHGFRQLIGKLHLQDHPGELEVLRRFYNHRSIDVTTNNYVGFNAAAAAKRVDDHILALRAAIPDPKGQ